MLKRIPHPHGDDEDACWWPARYPDSATHAGGFLDQFVRTPWQNGHGLADGDDETAVPLSGGGVLRVPRRRLGDAHAQLPGRVDLFPGRRFLRPGGGEREQGHQRDEARRQSVNEVLHGPFPLRVGDGACPTTRAA